MFVVFYVTYPQTYYSYVNNNACLKLRLHSSPETYYVNYLIQ